MGRSSCSPILMTLRFSPAKGGRRWSHRKGGVAPVMEIPEVFIEIPENNYWLNEFEHIKEVSYFFFFFLVGNPQREVCFISY